MNRLNIADNIVCLRHDKKITQEQLAEFIGVTKASVSKWENGVSYPEIDKIIKISETFHVSTDYLLKDNFKGKIKEENIEKAALQFLCVSQDMEKMSEQIIEIMREGVIDDAEKAQLEESMAALEHVIENIVQIKQTILSGK